MISTIFFSLFVARSEARQKRDGTTVGAAVAAGVDVRNGPRLAQSLKPHTGYGAA